MHMDIIHETFTTLIIYVISSCSQLYILLVLHLFCMRLCNYNVNFIHKNNWQRVIIR